MKHTNDGKCVRCQEIFDKYPGFNELLRDWFVGFQAKHPEAHISCAGRGREEQTALYLRGASKAKYGESAHNFNCAIDIFEQGGHFLSNIYEGMWFIDVLRPNLPAWAEWYGQPWAKFREMPHVEVKNWKFLVADGAALPVEPIPVDPDDVTSR